MNTQNAFGSNPNSAADTMHDAEATLRLIANLPAPDDLENRVIAGLRSAPRSGSILNWRGLLNPNENWLRMAAAAAIVFVVVGGGWGVYSRVQPNSAIATPPVAGGTGGFSNAGAVRVPQTLPTPVVIQPAPSKAPAAEPVKKAHGKVTPGVHRDAKAASANKTQAQPPVTVAR